MFKYQYVGKTTIKLIFDRDQAPMNNNLTSFFVHIDDKFQGFLKAFLVLNALFHYEIDIINPHQFKGNFIRIKNICDDLSNDVNFTSYQHWWYEHFVMKYFIRSKCPLDAESHYFPFFQFNFAIKKSPMLSVGNQKSETTFKHYELVKLKTDIESYAYIPRLFHIIIF